MNIKRDYQKTVKEIYQEYHTSGKGLSSKEAKRRIKNDGKNVLNEQKKISKLELFFKQFKNVMIILLLVVGLLSLFNAIVNDGDYLEAIVILGTSLINCFMGYLQEAKAIDAISKLKKYGADYVMVKRDNKFKKINAKNLVVGDYILLESGDKIPADARIVDCRFAKVDESLLTGESMSVFKSEDVVENSSSIADRTNMVYSGTVLVSGKIDAVVVATGMNSEIGKIALAMESTKEALTPLQIKIQKVSKFITMVAFCLVLLVLIYGLINQYDFLTIVMLGVSMIIASVPESLPIAITSTLTIGIKQMAKEKAIVRNLAAIETLGSTNIICTDKTGTLTENKIKVTKIFESLNYGSDVNNLSKELINIMSLCNTAYLNEHKCYIGDSVDVALKNYLGSFNVNKKIKLEIPFDSDRKIMSVIDEDNYIYSKGSFESLGKRCSKVLVNNKVVKLSEELKDKYLKEEEKMSLEGLKVIALAYKVINKEILKEEDYLKEENDFILVGLVGMKDPIRKDIKEAITTCKNAHIKPIMLTGDNKETAYMIAKEVGICSSKDECLNASVLDNLSSKELNEYVKKYTVFARVSPEHKLRIVSSLEEQGLVVAMSGDGVNDAPALKKANVGIGMGKSGTDVTKDVSDIILLDDSYDTIVTAVKEGRRIYDNVISNILYNLSSNFTEIIIILFGMFTGNTIIGAIHILYIDLVADTLPSITLAFENASSDVMKRKPNGLAKPIFDKYFSCFLIISVIIETVLSIIVYYHFLPLGIGFAQTLALLSIIINEFIFAYNCRSLKEVISKRGIFSNKYLNLGIMSLLIVQLLVFFTPIGKIFALETIGIKEFIYVVVVNIISFIIIELIKPLLNKLIKE